MMHDKINADEIDKLIQNIYELETSIKDTELDSDVVLKKQVVASMLDCVTAYLRYKTVCYLKEAEEKTREVRLV